MAADKALEKVRKAAERFDVARAARDAAIADAAGDHSLRAIAKVAGVTHETVRSIIRAEEDSAAASS